MRKNETIILFRTDILGSLVGENPTTLHVLSESTIQLAVSAIRCAEWTSRATVGGSDVYGSGDSDLLRQWYNRAIDELLGGISMDDLIKVLRHINANLGKLTDDTGTEIAQVADYSAQGLGYYVSEIESKTPGLIDLPDIIAGLSGSGSFQELEALLSILDVIPGIDIQLSAADVASFLFQVYWRQKLLAAQVSQALSQRTIAGTMIADDVTDEFNQWINTLLEALDIVDIVGDGWNAFFANLLQLVDMFLTGEEPRAAVDVLNKVFVEGDKLKLTVNNYCCVGGINIDVSFEQSPATPANPEPEGTIDPDGGIANRECKVANLIVDELTRWSLELDGVSWLDKTSYEIGTWLSNTSAYLGDLLSEAAQAAQGWITGNIVGIRSFIEGGGSFGSIHTNLTDNRATFVCILFDNYDNAEDAKALLLAEFDADEQSMLNQFLPNNIFNLLSRGIGGSEAVIDEYSPPTDCSECVVCPEYEIIWGTEILADLQQVDSENTGSREQISVRRNYDGGYCGGYEPLTDVTWLSGAAPNENFHTRALDQTGSYVFDQIDANSFDNFVATLPRSDVALLIVNRASGEPGANDDFSLDIDWSL